MKECGILFSAPILSAFEAKYTPEPTREGEAVRRYRVTINGWWTKELKARDCNDACRTAARKFEYWETFSAREFRVVVVTTGEVIS